MDVSASGHLRPPPGEYILGGHRLPRGFQPPRLYFQWEVNIGFLRGMGVVRAVKFYGCWEGSVTIFREAGGGEVFEWGGASRVTSILQSGILHLHSGRILSNFGFRFDQSADFDRSLRIRFF